MATVTLTPDLYIQTTGTIVTAINPVNKEIYATTVSWSAKYVFIRYPVDATKKYTHAVITANTTEKAPPWHTDTYNGGIYLAVESTKSNNNPTYNVGDKIGFDGSFKDIYFYSPDPQYDTQLGTVGRVQSGYMWLSLKPALKDENPTSFTFTDLLLTLTYEAVSPTMALNPSGGYLSVTTDNTISFTDVTPDDTIRPYIVSTSTLYYKKSTETQYTEIQATGSTVVLPAGTLESSTDYTLYADYVTTDGSTGTTAVYNYTTVDTVGTVTGRFPNNTIETGEVVFTWGYSNSTGTQQYAYDLEISDDGETFTSLVSHAVTNATTTTQAISTAGTKYWRVRSYNQNDVPSAYSSPLNFISVVKPAAPVITNITGAGRITVIWAADSQAAYELEVLSGDTIVYDSTTLYTSDNEHLINDYLPNGLYTIRVKVINMYGFESDYGTIQYPNSNAGSINVTVDTSNGVVLSFPEGYTTYYILRDGEIIAKTSEATYTDLYASGTYLYTVVAVQDDTYALGSVEATYKTPYTRLIDLEGNIYDISHRFNARIGITQTDEADADTALYLGAVRPSHTFGTGRVRRYSVSFAYKGDYTQFMAKVVRYMDIYGNTDWVVIPNVSRANYHYGNELTASLEVTAYTEGITYDL